MFNAIKAIMTSMFGVMASRRWSADRLKFGDDLWQSPQMVRNLYRQRERGPGGSSLNDVLLFKATALS